MASIVESWKRMGTFVSETRSELKKVTFPPRTEVISTTTMVLIASVIFAFFLWLADLVIIELYRGVLEIFGG